VDGRRARLEQRFNHPSGDLAGLIGRPQGEKGLSAQVLRCNILVVRYNPKDVETHFSGDVREGRLVRLGIPTAAQKQLLVGKSELIRETSDPLGRTETEAGWIADALDARERIWASDGRKRDVSMTLKEVATRSEISIAHLSQVERGDAIPSILALFAISATLGVLPEYLLRGDDEGEGWYGMLATGGENSTPRQYASPELSKIARIVSAEDRHAVMVTGAVESQWLTGDDEPIQLLQRRLAAGASIHDLALGQQGSEVLAVLEGSLQVELGGSSQVLSPGSSISYSRATSRRFTAMGPDPAVGMWVIAPNQAYVHDTTAGVVSTGRNRPPVMAPQIVEPSRS